MKKTVNLFHSIYNEGVKRYMKIRRPFHKIKSYAFNGKKYRMLWRKHPKDRASCDSPDTPEEHRNMFIDPRGEDAKEFMEVILHEGTHAEQWYLDEDTTIRISEELSKLLWDVGYRLTDGKGNIID